MKNLITYALIALVGIMYSFSMLSLAPDLGTSGSMDFTYPVRAAVSTYSDEPLNGISEPAEDPILKIDTYAKPEPDYGLTTEEIELIALVTIAEAEGECEIGQRLVIDTILNRRDSEYFPDTIHDVIYQRNQFSCMWSGRVERCVVKEDICNLVREEALSRLDYECVFFNAKKYSIYGVPLFQVGNHYFSKYEED